MRIRNSTRSTQLASDARPARGFWSRLVGLLGRASLQPGEALVLDPCNSVHTVFMRFPIDVVYVDRSRQVLKVVPDLKPFRVSGVLRGVCAVIELPSGTIANTGTAPGDQLVFEP
ncbi:MAG: hypothetical protein A2148_11870 [Chloroflexi bacterium RBG_16_68_14]|nr:MAG: hypothetical protein A2148_11870 [Chloroflexi bacterium RBG_16_68_14]